MVTSDSHWVFWGRMNDQGGPESYYLYNVVTGARRRFTDALTASGVDLSGAVLAGDSLYVAGTVKAGRCPVDEVLRVNLATGEATPMVVARHCAVEAAPRLPKLLSLGGTGLPLKLSGVVVAEPALAGRRLLFVITPPTDSSVSPPAALVQLDLDNGKAKVLAQSPSLISALVADPDVAAFVSGPGLYALVNKGLELLETTQNPVPTVSGPLVSCGGGSGDVYDVRTGAVYRPPAVGSWTILSGSWVSWFDSAAQAYRAARIEPSRLQ